MNLFLLLFFAHYDSGFARFHHVGVAWRQVLWQALAAWLMKLCLGANDSSTW